MTALFLGTQLVLNSLLSLQYSFTVVIFWAFFSHYQFCLTMTMVYKYLSHYRSAITMYLIVTKLWALYFILLQIVFTLFLVVVICLKMTKCPWLLHSCDHHGDSCRTMIVIYIIVTKLWDRLYLIITVLVNNFYLTVAKKPWPCYI